MIRLAAVDDNRILTSGMAAWSAPRHDVRLVTAVETVDRLLRRGTGDIDVVLLNLLLADRSDPVGNIRRLASAGPSVIVLSVVTDPGEVMAAFAAGASGFVAKDRDLDDLAEVVRCVAAGADVCEHEMGFAMARDRRPRRPGLSAKELQLLRHYAAGMTLDATARRIGIRPGTARRYLTRIKEKYRDAGRPTYTKLDLADRLREDGLALRQTRAPES